MQLFQEFILSQWLILAALSLVFLAISRWSVVVLREYAGYGLGCLMGLFFILVYASLGGDAEPTNTRVFLNGFQVFLATLMGLFFGAIIIAGIRFGMQYARAIAIQVALYTALNIILIFLVVIEGPIAQRMIGIFALAIGIATLFAMVLFPTSARREELNIRAQGVTQSTQPYDLGSGGGGGNSNGGSRLDEIRQRMKSRETR